MLEKYTIKVINDEYYESTSCMCLGNSQIEGKLKIVYNYLSLIKIYNPKYLSLCSQKRQRLFKQLSKEVPKKKFTLNT